MNEQNSPRPQLLIADDDADSLETLGMAVSNFEVDVHLAEDGKIARQILDNQRIDLIVSDQHMPGFTGLELLAYTREIKPNPPLFILISGFGTIDMAIDAMRTGAHDFLKKPFEMLEFLARLEKALNLLEMQNENRALRHAVESHYVFSEIVGTSKKLRSCLDLAARATDNPSPVLILGESGTGKDLLARAIHFHGSRKTHPFVAINCGAIAENLIESELFGHKKGSFTGAISNRQGCFEEAGHGTLFLDEIGEMPLELQVKLLRVLEAKQIRRVGENREIPVHCRILAATNRPLLDQVKEGLFREDLYYRLNVIAIELPTLRDRPEDIIPLTELFLKQIAEELNRPTPSITPQSLTLLQNCKLPGNARELFNILQRAMLLSDSDIIEPDSLPQPHSTLRRNTDIATESSLDMKAETRKATYLVEQRLIAKALEETNNNHKQAAKLLGISRGSLYNKIGKTTPSPSE